MSFPAEVLIFFCFVSPTAVLGCPFNLKIVDETPTSISITYDFEGCRSLCCDDSDCQEFVWRSRDGVCTTFATAAPDSNQGVIIGIKEIEPAVVPAPAPFPDIPSVGPTHPPLPEGGSEGSEASEGSKEKNEEDGESEGGGEDGEVCDVKVWDIGENSLSVLQGVYVLQEGLWADYQYYFYDKGSAYLYHDSSEEAWFISQELGDLEPLLMLKTDAAIPHMYDYESEALQFFPENEDAWEIIDDSWLASLCPFEVECDIVFEGSHDANIDGTYVGSGYFNGYPYYVHVNSGLVVFVHPVYQMWFLAVELGSFMDGFYLLSDEVVETPDLVEHWYTVAQSGDLVDIGDRVAFHSACGILALNTSAGDVPVPSPTQYPAEGEGEGETEGEGEYEVTEMDLCFRRCYQNEIDACCGDQMGCGQICQATDPAVGTCDFNNGAYHCWVEELGYGIDIDNPDPALLAGVSMDCCFRACALGEEGSCLAHGEVRDVILSDQPLYTCGECISSYGDGSDGGEGETDGGESEGGETTPGGGGKPSPDGSTSSPEDQGDVEASVKEMEGSPAVAAPDSTDSTRSPEYSDDLEASESGMDGSPAVPAPSPAPTLTAASVCPGCSRAGVDPWTTGSYIECCPGTSEILKEWNRDGTWFFVCMLEDIPYDPTPDDRQNLIYQVYIDTSGLYIMDEPKIPANMFITLGGNVFYDGNIGIEWRGKSSLTFPKKSFGFETWDENNEDKDVALLGFPEEEDWILYGPYSDKTLLRNVFIYDLSNQIGHYAARTEFCEVYINDEYTGVYVFMEKLKRDSERIDIKKLKKSDESDVEITGGYILKLDKSSHPNGELYFDDTMGFQSKFAPANSNATGAEPFWILYEYPSSDDITEKQKSYISGFFDDFERSLASAYFKDPTNGYRKYADESSFIHYFLMCELANNIDCFRVSVNFYKDRGEKLKIGPIWDFNLGFGNADYCFGFKTDTYRFNYYCLDTVLQVPFWWDRMLEDDVFVDQLKSTWRSLRTSVLSDANMIDLIDSYVTFLDDETGAVGRNFKRWDILGKCVWPNYFIGNSFEEEINVLKEWLLMRAQWLDVAIGDL